MAKSCYDEWCQWGKESQWTVPEVSVWKRLPGIRHLRLLYRRVTIEKKDDTGYDEWVSWGIWNGFM